MIDFLFAGDDNPSSLLNSIKGARENARMTRTALTRDVWEAINETWLQFKQNLAEKAYQRDVQDVLSSIRQQSALVRGSISATMLRNDIYRFAQLGSLFERSTLLSFGLQS